MTADVSLAEAGCRAIVDFLEDHGRHADAHRFQARLNREAAAAKIAKRERDRLSVVDRFFPCAETTVDQEGIARVLQDERSVLRAYLVTKQMRHSPGTQAVLAVFTKIGELPSLVDHLRQENVVSEGTAVVVLGRRNEQIEALLRDVPGALLFDRGKQPLKTS